MKKIKSIILLFFFVILSQVDLMATHIRAADITAERIDGTTYRYSVRLYTDYQHTPDNPNAINPIDVSTITVGLGVQGESIPFTVDRASVEEILPGEIYVNTYVFDQQLNANVVNKVYVTQETRNIGIVNIENPEGMNIYLDMFTFFSNLSPFNNSPKFTVHPIDKAVVGQVFTHNPGAFDLDGDSLTFELLEPKDRLNTSVGGYRYPDDPSFGTPSSFSMDINSGQIVWDTPKQAGEYNILYRVNEYRNGIRVGYVERDMQIIVEESDNEPPVLDLPTDTCISTNQLYHVEFNASDPNRNTIDMELSGGIVELGGTFNATNVLPDVILAEIDWVPGCDAVRRLPIQSVVRVTDDHKISLSTVDYWEITVVGEAPNLVSATANEDVIYLNWDSYLCNEETASMVIYRAACDTSFIHRNVCEVGVPDSWGFERIGEVPIDQTNFIDDGSVLELVSGTSYFYMISVEFGSPGYGESYASNLVSSNLEGGSPLISQVSYNKESKDRLVTISWDHFTEVDTSIYEKPFTYNLKVEGDVVYSESFNALSGGSIDLDSVLFVNDRSVSLQLVDSENIIIGYQSVAFAEKSTSIPKNKALTVNWTNLNTWYYNDTLYQKIYSFKLGEDTVLVDSVRGGVTNYTINDLTNKDTVCAYVETSYVYCVEGVDSVFSGFTSASCAIVDDEVAPEPPVLSLELIDCSLDFEGNNLTWEPVFEMNNDIAYFELYVVESSNKTDYVKIDSSTILTYLDTAGQSLNCYYVTATDSAGNVSQPSNIVCQGFCGDFEWPNIITPNSDGLNDVFMPVSNLDGVTDINLIILNRWGKEIYRTQDKVDIPWDAKTKNGKTVTDGTYYFFFTAKNFADLNKELEYKGWLQVIGVE